MPTPRHLSTKTPNVVLLFFYDNLFSAVLTHQSQDGAGRPVGNADALRHALLLETVRVSISQCRLYRLPHPTSSIIWMYMLDALDLFEVKNESIVKAILPGLSLFHVYDYID